MLQLRHRAAPPPRRGRPKILQFRPRPAVFSGPAARRRRHNDVGARLDPGHNPQVKSLQVKNLSPSPPPRPDILGPARRRRRHNDVGARLDPGQNPQVKSLRESTTNPLKRHYVGPMYACTTKNEESEMCDVLQGWGPRDV